MKEDTYYLNDEKHELTKHGFARESEFEVTKWSPNEMEFSLKSSLKTYPSYPFDFDFRVRYELDGRTLIQHFKVTNTDEERMPFSLGAHPAFICNPDTDHLKFDQPETEEAGTIDENGLVTGEKRPIFDEDKIRLSRNLFDRDALIFQNLNSGAVSLVDGSGQRILTVSLTEFPYLGIWAKPGADYVCIEPWAGIADPENHNQKIDEKPGIMWLSPNETMKWSLRMKFEAL